MSPAIGQRFGKLVVLASAVQGRHRICTCRCDCGTEKNVRASVLASGDAKSCGCYRAERIATMNHRHGATKGGPTPEWRVWRAMHQRCDDRNYRDFPTYGGRGIKVCARWSGERGFEAFLSDMGPRPSPAHSLDRTNNDGNYEPGNCRWATRSQQALNRRARHRDELGRFDATPCTPSTTTHTRETR